MPKLIQVEKGIFMRLFNRGGYVLNFSTTDFDVFTLESIGIPLCKEERLGFVDPNHPVGTRQFFWNKSAKQ